MSKKYPVIAITGSSGSETTTVKYTFEHIFKRLNLLSAVIEGNSFYRYPHQEMQAKINLALQHGENFSHFSIEANLLKELQQTFKKFGEKGTAKRRYYLGSLLQATQFKGKFGEFSEWEDIPIGTDVLFYEGLHGAVKTEHVNVPKYADLIVGVVPIVNLEWIQKIHRDTAVEGSSSKDVTKTILRRMNDYVNVITPQFARTHINFQRVPTIDTSNPFIANDLPSADESFVIIRFEDPARFKIDFPWLLAMIHQSFMSRSNTIVVPGGKMELAMELIFTPIIERMMKERFL
ncbi:MAG: phosphoribulokinase [Gammaproteobacteria bacterium]|nr:phosphoribulokinase [Gammaproteobacteria bacterium]